MAIAGDYAVVSGINAVYVYKRSGTSWVEQQRLTADDGSFGTSVAITDGNIWVGAPFIDW